jgi:acyl carrier protein
MRVKEYIDTHPVPSDSLEVMEFIMEVEDEFDIIIDYKEVQKFTTKEQFIALIEEKLK